MTSLKLTVLQAYLLGETTKTGGKQRNGRHLAKHRRSDMEGIPSAAPEEAQKAPSAPEGTPKAISAPKGARQASRTPEEA